MDAATSKPKMGAEWVTWALLVGCVLVSMALWWLRVGYVMGNLLESPGQRVPLLPLPRLVLLVMLVGHPNGTNSLPQASPSIGRIRLAVTCILTILGGVGTFIGFAASGHPLESLPILAIYCLVLGLILTGSHLPTAHGVQLGLGLALSCLTLVAFVFLASAALMGIIRVSLLGNVAIAGLLNIPMVLSGLVGRVTLAKGRQAGIAFSLSCLIAFVIAAVYTYLSWWRP